VAHHYRQVIGRAGRSAAAGGCIAQAQQVLGGRPALAGVRWVAGVPTRVEGVIGALMQDAE